MNLESRNLESPCSHCKKKKTLVGWRPDRTERVRTYCECRDSGRTDAAKLTPIDGSDKNKLTSMYPCIVAFFHASRRRFDLLFLSSSSWKISSFSSSIGPSKLWHVSIHGNVVQEISSSSSSSSSFIIFSDGTLGRG